ncbi:MAG: SGNH/GDSL hydrolase family protein [Thermoguttaceae bacterium]
MKPCPRLAIALVVATMCAAIRAGEGTQDGSATPLRGKIVAVSDSLTNNGPDNWLALLAKKSPEIRVVAEAHGGWTTKSYFKPKFADVAFAKVPRDADLFILLLGSNNLFEAGGGSDEAVREATEGIEQIAAHLLKISSGAKIVLVAPPNVCLKNYKVETPKPTRRMEPDTPQYLQKLGQSYRALAQRKSWRFIDLFPVLGDDDFIDAAHPGKTGNQKMAAAIWHGLN